MNLIKRFFEWIMGWVIMGVIVLALGFGISTFGGGNSDENTTKPTKETTLSKDEKLIEVRKEYWDNGNLKSEAVYKKHYHFNKPVTNELRISHECTRARLNH